MATVSDTLGFDIPSWPPKMAGVSDTLSDLGTPRQQVYQIHLVFYPILAPKMAGVSDTLGFLPHLGTPRRQVYQIHLVFYPKMAGVSDTHGFLSDLGTPRRQVYQIHLVFYPILAPQDSRCIRYTWFSIRSWHPKTAGVSDTPGFLPHLGPPRQQVYQIHMVFYPILAPQDGRCIRHTWFSIPSWHPKMAGPPTWQLYQTQLV